MHVRVNHKWHSTVFASTLCWLLDVKLPIEVYISIPEKCTHILAENVQTSWTASLSPCPCKDGLHVMHDSHHSWAEQSLGLMIEQCFMQSLKTNGKLTRDWGFSDITTVWVLSLSICAEVNNSMQYLIEVHHKWTTQRWHKGQSSMGCERYPARPTRQDQASPTIHGTYWSAFTEEYCHRCDCITIC